ncbi:MAG: DNA oxidative demethylase AlkB [Rhodospirillales bacterium]|jgi:alkylated DNA repair protein (DNA oxidative demethylase)|nr:DNA oxidative demethylase AlkB [Rhodospirillales bacterium]
MAQGQPVGGEFLVPQPARLVIGEGAVLLGGFAVPRADELVAAIGEVAAEAPFRTMTTPGGRQMSVAMTNCGAAGWVSDRAGYRYSRTDPDSGRPWPAMPELFAGLAADAAAAAGYPGFAPDACLVNRYDPGAQLSLHQDRNERGCEAPIVSVSLGLPATFLFGGRARSDPTRPYALHHGDVVVWGGPSRLFYHGVRRLADGIHPVTARVRFNLTLRQAL